MLFETLLLKKLYRTEKFEEESKALSVLDFILITSLLVYVIAAFFLWGRVVFNAFGCNLSQGFASVMFPGLYSLFKFGDTIKATC